MFKVFRKISLVILGSGAICLPLAAFAATTALAPAHVKGRILLDVQRHGEAWYIEPVGAKRTYLADGPAAYTLLRKAGLGIKDADIWRIPVGLATDMQSGDLDTDGDLLPDQMEGALGTDPNKADTDGDTFKDGAEITAGYSPVGAGKYPVDAGLVKSLSGRILLQVEKHGEAWYLNPVDGKRYYMKDGAAAYGMMRKFGLGAQSTFIDAITQSDAVAVVPPVTPAPTETVTTPTGPLSDCGTDVNCFTAAVDKGKIAKVVAELPYSDNLILHTTMYLLADDSGTGYKFHSVTQRVIGGATKDAKNIMVCPKVAPADVASTVREWVEGTFDERYQYVDGENDINVVNHLTTCKSYTEADAAAAGITVYPQ